MKKEGCSFVANTNIYQCKSPFKYRKIAQSCTLNEEYLTGFCEDNKNREVAACKYDDEYGEGRFCSKK